MKVKIVQKTIQALKPPKHGRPVIVWDREIGGLGIQITSAGAVSWVLDYRIHHRRRRLTFGRSPELTVTAARDEVLGLLRDIRDGIDPMEKREQDLAEPTMAELADEYLSRYAMKEKRASSVRNDKGMLAKHILPRFGSLRVDAVSQRDIEVLHASMQSRLYRANRVLALLSKMFTLAIRWGYRDDNPVRGVKRFDEPIKERWLSREELRRFSDALDIYHDQDAADALRLLMFTGAREQEALGANWSQFDLTRAEWTRQAHSTKEKKLQHVPLNDYALELLRKMHAQSGGKKPLFPGRGGTRARVTIRRAFVQVCKLAGLAEPYSVQGRRRTLSRYRPTLRIHDLRHSFASHLVSDGVSLGLVGQLLGHSVPSTTQRYAHYSNQALRDASNRFAKALGETADEKQRPTATVH
jgi:integrase